MLSGKRIAKVLLTLCGCPSLSVPLLHETKSGPKVIKLFSCSTQLSTKFQLLIISKLLTNEEVYCFKSLRCCIYHHANKC